jgi:hypothetical protein
MREWINLFEDPRINHPKRINTAESEGFDTSKIWYHGSGKTFTKFKEPDDKGINELGIGVYLTSEKYLANTWARRGGKIYECFIKPGDIYDFSKPLTPAVINRLHTGHSKFMENRYGPKSAYSLKSFMNILRNKTDRQTNKTYLHPDANKLLNLSGYIGAIDHRSQIPGQIVIFDPRNVFILRRLPGE